MFITEKDYEECVDKGIIHAEKESAKCKALRYAQDHRKGIIELVNLNDNTEEKQED